MQPITQFQWLLHDISKSEKSISSTAAIITPTKKVKIMDAYFKLEVDFFST